MSKRAKPKKIGNAGTTNHAWKPFHAWNPTPGNLKLPREGLPALITEMVFPACASVFGGTILSTNELVRLIVNALGGKDFLEILKVLNSVQNDYWLKTEKEKKANNKQYWYKSISPGAKALDGMSSIEHVQLQLQSSIFHVNMHLLKR